MSDRCVLLGASPKQCNLPTSTKPCLPYTKADVPTALSESAPAERQRWQSLAHPLACSSYLPSRSGLRHQAPDFALALLRRVPATWILRVPLGRRDDSSRVLRRRQHCLPLLSQTARELRDLVFGQLSHVLSRSSRAHVAGGGCGAGRAWRLAVNGLGCGSVRQPTSSCPGTGPRTPGSLSGPPWRGCGASTRRWPRRSS